jgi:DNA-repair protein XRCC1
MNNGDEKGKKQQSDSPDIEHRSKPRSDDAQYDSNTNVEMTEEEIDLVCRQIPGLLLK